MSPASPETERQHLRCWLGAAPLPAARAKALRARARALGAGHSWEARRGRLFSLLGDLETAQACLDRALIARSDNAAALAWRGELALLRGDLAKARSCLDAAIKLDRRLPWAYIYRAALWVKIPDHERARADLRTFRLLRPGSAAGYGLQALLDLPLGKKAALRLLDRALMRRPAAWALALRADLATSGDPCTPEVLRRSYADLGRALRGENAAWIRLARARLTAMGRPRQAYRDLALAVRTAPADPAVLSQAAVLYLGWADPPKAAEALGRAVAISPEDPALRLRRAEVLALEGRLPEAAVDLGRAVALSPGRPDLEEAYARLLAVSGREEEAESLIARGAWKGGAGRSILATVRCRQGRFKEAESLFSEAERLSPPGSGEAKFASFLRWTVRVMARAEPASGRRELVFCGCGFTAPFQVSVGVVHELMRAELIYNNILGPELPATLRFLGLFRAPVRSLHFGSPEDQRFRARTAVAGLKDASRIAIVTRGQSLILGGFARACRRAAAGAGVPFRSMESVSAADIATVAAPEALAGSAQLQVRLHGRIEGLDPKVPVYLYEPNYAQPGQLAGLERMYPAGHRAYSFLLNADELLRPWRSPLGRVLGAPAEPNSLGSVLIPPARRR